MDRGNDFLKSQIHDAIVQHYGFVKSIEDHEAQAEDARFRDLCTRYIATMRDHQRMLEDYQSELGAPSAGTLRRSAGPRAAAARNLADTAQESEFSRLQSDLLMSLQAEDAFKIFREAGRALGLRGLAEIGTTGERDHSSYSRDANRLAQQMFIERARSPEIETAATGSADLAPG
ncbi:MAG: hypothetical protein ABI338_02440 [Gemmatimonadaceae bacterium]